MQKGDKVIIKECHKIPQLVGATATVVAVVPVTESNHYPIGVVPDNVFPPAVLGFREDELEPIYAG